MHDFIFHLSGHKTVISQRLTHFTINDYIMKSSMISLSAVQAIGLGTMLVLSKCTSVFSDTSHLRGKGKQNM